MFEELDGSGQGAQASKDVFEVSLDDTSEIREVTPGIFGLEITKAKKSKQKDSGADVLTVDYVIEDGPDKGVHAKDRFDFSKDWDRDRAKRFVTAFGVTKNAAGKYDLSEGALIGRKGSAYLKWDAFFDTNRPARYVRPGAAPADAAPVLR